MTIVEMLEIHAQNIPDHTAIIYDDITISYSEFNNKVNKLFHAFVDMGINKGDVVGLMLPRIPELVISFLAIAKTNGVVMPINFELFDNKIRALLQNTTPKCLIVDEKYVDLAKRSIPSGSDIFVVVVGNNNYKDYLNWDEVLRDKDSTSPFSNITQRDVVYLNYTSGTTGNPKGAITTHEQIYRNTLAAVDAFNLTEDDIHLCMFAPFAHPHEIFARPLYLGGTMVLLDKIYPKSLAKTIADHRVTCMMGLPPMYNTLLDLLEHYEYDLSSLRIPESGGMYTRQELIDRFKQKIGVPILPVWGSTETTGIAIANRPDEDMIPGSVGKPCKSYEVKIIDDKGDEVAANDVGEILFKGPAVVSGYYEDIINTNDCFRNGWYCSGDLGKKDAEGNIYFVERKAGMMKVAGLKVYPLEIELAIIEHPNIREVAVIALKDRLRGEVPKAIIVTSNGERITQKDVLKFCRGKMTHYKIPRIVEIRESLPKIGSGKINKKLLQMEEYGCEVS